MMDTKYWNERFADYMGHELHSSKEEWNARAQGFARKPKRSGYIAQLMDLLNLQPGESVFDMGSGPGTLSIPLAQQGHKMYAVDFSEAMLAELAQSAKDAGVEVRTFQRAWQDDWSDLPVADMAVASRSLITTDLADALAKLESKARSRVALVINAGETPATDLTLMRAIGRDVSEADLYQGFVVVLNYLFAWGRRPEVRYITYPRRNHAKTVEELFEVAKRSCQPCTDQEMQRLERFVNEHLMREEDTGDFRFDYGQTAVWGCIQWEIPQKMTC